jgi:hypothetical protein
MNLNLADSKGWTVRKIPARPGDCIFVYADPNSVATLPVTPELIDSFTSETLFLMTLGCNVGGCKRLPREDREQWMKTAFQVIERTHRRHDIILVWLNRDAAQWAYLAAVPRVWAEGTLSAAVKSGNKLWPQNGVSGLSLKTHGRDAITDKFKELFLTQEEIKTAR